MDNLYDPRNIDLLHHVQQALRAHTLFKRDVDYIVKSGQVIIVDEFTGRIMPGRRYSEGLHQALEAKENVKIENENQTLASITFQNYFRMYDKLAGMTGTAETEAAEFAKIYKLEVVVIPTHRKMIRTDHPDCIYRTEKEKFRAAVEEIKELHKIGRPVLVGTVSIEKSERLSEMLKTAGRPAPGAECQASRKGSRNRGQGGAARDGHHLHQHGRARDRHCAGSRRGWPRAACTSSAPNAMKPGGSTTSSAAVPGARVIRGRRASTSRWKTI